MWYFHRATSCAIGDTTFERWRAAIPADLCGTAGGGAVREFAGGREVAVDAGPGEAAWSLTDGGAAGV